MFNPSDLPEMPLTVLGDRLIQASPDRRFPYSGQWELTCRCNLQCRMCYTDCFNTPDRISQELSTSEIRRILDELKEAGCIELVLTGGEPLARPDFFEIYDTAHQAGFLLTVFTNGTLITPAIADRFAARPPKMIEISLHGVTADVFDGITQKPGSWRACRAAIERLAARRLPLTLKAVVMTLNQSELPEIKRFARNLGENVQFRWSPEMRDDLLLSGQPFQFQVAASALPGVETADAPHSTSSECAGGDETFHIDAYGRLQRCSNNRRASFDLRKGSFAEGFRAMAAFPCPKRSVISTHEPSVALPILGFRR